MNDFEEIRERHFVVILSHVSRNLPNGWWQAQRSGDQAKLIDTSDIYWILVAVLGEQVESLSKGVDVLLGEMFQMLRHGFQ